MSETAKLNHLGVIIDGNRRWASDRGMLPIEGHRAGYEVIKNMAYAARARGVKYMSGYIWSTENWGRPENEVTGIMDLFLWALKRDMKKLIRDGFRIVFLGSRDRLSKKIIAAIESAEKDSINNTECTLALCFNYGGHQEIVDACRKICASDVDPSEINEELFAQNLYHPEIPPIDMMVRTSGEMRISNFMLWRVAYSEFMFVDKKWPDMTENDLDDIVAEFNSRQRRFGK